MTQLQLLKTSPNATRLSVKGGNSFWSSSGSSWAALSLISSRSPVITLKRTIELLDEIQDSWRGKRTDWLEEAHVALDVGAMRALAFRFSCLGRGIRDGATVQGRKQPTVLKSRMPNESFGPDITFRFCNFIALFNAVYR